MCNSYYFHLDLKLRSGCAVLLAATTLIFSCGGSKQSNAEEALIRQARQVSNDAIASKDTAQIASVWTLDYHVVTSRNFEVSGRNANRDRFAAEYKTKPDVIYVRTPVEVHVFNNWNMASENGSWTGRWTDEGEACELTGTYFAKWHKANGRWLIRAEVFVPLTCRGKFCNQPPI